MVQFRRIDLGIIVWTKAEVTSTLFLRLGLQSTLIRHENKAFPKRSSNRRGFKMPAFHFLVDWEHFWKRSFSKTMTSRQSRDFPSRGSLEHKSNMSVFKFLRCGEDGKQSRCILRVRFSFSSSSSVVWMALDFFSQLYLQVLVVQRNTINIAKDNSDRTKVASKWIEMLF